MSRRRKEPILGYVPKNDKRKNLVHKGLTKKTRGVQSLFYSNYEKKINYVEV